MNATIRSAALEDSSALGILAGDLGYPTTVDQMRGRLEWLLRSDNHAVFVAELDGLLAGWIHVYAYRVLESEARAELGGLVVGREFRRQGIGRELVWRAESWARTWGLGMISVRSNAAREDARLFYERLRYQMTKTQLSFRKPL